MKLRALDGRFFGNIVVAQRGAYMQGDKIEGAQGVIFQCPACAKGKPPGEPNGVGFAGAHYVKICFSNPRGAPVAPPEYDGNPRWEMSGTSLDDLTLAPSINLDTPLTEKEAAWYSENPHVERCIWHGFVKNGDAS